MRAKEKLEFNKPEFEFYELVKKSIYDLYPLRTNKRKTEEYCDNHLFADARCREIFKINNCNHESVNFRENDDEIDHLISYRVRKEIQNAICDDKTFIYAYNIIERDHNPYNDVYKSKSLQLKPETLTTSREIEEEISRYKEDYPKSNLSDYLIDEANFKFYNERFLNLSFDDEGWLFIFNKAYEIFDRIRTFASNPSQAHYMANNIYFGDKMLEDAIIDVLLLLIDNYSYDLTPEQVKKFRLLSFFIRKHRDPQTLTIEKKYLDKIHSLNLTKVDWMKATRYFNVHLITHWVTYHDLSLEQQLQILNQIKERYLTEKQRNPDFFCYDLSECFSQLQQLLTSDEPPPGCNGSPAPSTNTINPSQPKNQLPMVRMIEHLNTSLDELKEQNARLTRIITQQNEELRLLHEKHDEETRNMMMILSEHEENYNSKGFTLAQMVLLFYYLFNELGINFDNTPKVKWARFIQKVTGKHIQNIKTELDIEFETSKTQKNLKIMADLFRELLPQITGIIENDSK